MSQLEVLGPARAKRATNVAMVQQGPNPAGDAETIVDMEVDNIVHHATRHCTKVHTSRHQSEESS
jgi:hypothetical protein